MSLLSAFEGVASPSQTNVEFEQEPDTFYRRVDWSPHLAGQSAPKGNRVHATPVKGIGKPIDRFLYREGCRKVGECHQQLELSSCPVAALHNLLVILSLITRELMGMLDEEERKIGTSGAKMVSIIPQLLEKIPSQLNFNIVQLERASDMIQNAFYCVSITDNSPFGVESHVVVAERVSDSHVKTWDSQSGWVCLVPASTFDMWITGGDPDKIGDDVADALYFF